MPSLQEQLAHLQEAENQTAEAANTLQVLQKLLSKIINLDLECIDPDTPLGELGASSLDIIELAIRAESECKIAIDETYFSPRPEKTTLNHLSQLIDSLKKS